MQLLTTVAPGMFYASSVSFITNEITFISDEYKPFVTKIMGYILEGFYGLLVILSLGMSKYVEDSHFSKIIHFINAFLTLINISIISLALYSLNNTKTLFAHIISLNNWSNSAI